MRHVADPEVEQIPVHDDSHELLPCLREHIEKQNLRITDDHEEGAPPPVGWPKKLWVLEYSVDGPKTIQHGVVVWGDVHGLATFRTKKDCLGFAHLVKNPPSQVLKATEVSFEDAVKITERKGRPINAMILIAEPPFVHFIRDEDPE